jgi:hypothetical protein
MNAVAAILEARGLAVNSSRPSMFSMPWSMMEDWLNDPSIRRQ